MNYELKNSGVIYSCNDNLRFLEEAVVSAKSVKKNSPSLKICLFHNYDIKFLDRYDLDIFTEIKKVLISDDTFNKFKNKNPFCVFKLHSILNTPYDQTLFLDSDTEIKKPIDSLFKLLTKFDIAFAPGPFCQKPIDKFDIINEIPSEFPEPNTGVLLYSTNAKTKKFLSNWRRVFHDNIDGLQRDHGKGGEQVSLRYLLWSDTSVRPYVLSPNGPPNPFNYRFPDSGKNFSLKNSIVIHHARNRK